MIIICTTSIAGMNRNIVTMPANESIDVCFLCFTLFSWANCFLLCCSRLQINPMYIRYRSIGLLALTLGWVQLHTPLRTRLQAVNNQGLCLDRMKIWICIILSLYLKTQIIFKFVVRDFRCLIKVVFLILHFKCLMKVMREFYVNCPC